MNLTPWFPGNIKPVHTGVYQRKHAEYGMATNGEFGALLLYSYWNGEYWSLSRDTVERAYQLKDIKSPIQNLFWRGILKLENNS